MRREFIAVGVALALGASLAGCGQKNTGSAQSETSTDSLLSTNPVEQPQGNLTPQEQFTPDQQTQPPASASTPSAASRTPAPASKPKTKPSTPSSSPAKEEAKGVTLAAGTPIQVSVGSQISSETAQVGDSWTGEVKENVIVGNIVVIPSGSTVTGVVDAVQPAQKGSRASLSLAVRSVTVNGSQHSVAASTEAIEAGSTRARNLGAVAGGAAAGALIGKAVGGGGKGALIGGLIGGAAGAAGAAASKGYQVVVKEGTAITFSVDQGVVMKQ